MCSNNNNIIPAVTDMRLRAEERMKVKAPDVDFSLTDVSVHRYIHELHVHQIELEMQNEELCHAQNVAEAALIKYTDLYDFAPLGYFTLTGDGIVRAANLTGASLVGIERSRLIGRNFGLLVATEYRTNFTIFLGEVFTNSLRQGCEVALLNKENLRLIVQVEAIIAASGKECNLALIDITGRRQIEDVVQHQTEIICRNKADGTFTFVNEMYCRVFGKSREQLIGNRWSPDAFPDDVLNVKELLHELSPSHPIVNAEVRVCAETGKIRWIEFVHRGFFNAHGLLLETQSVGRDITERRETEIAYRTSEERLRVALDASKMGVWEWNIQNNFLFCSPECLDIIGVNETGFTFESFMHAIHPEDRDRVSIAAKKALRENSVFFEEYRFTGSSNGQMSWISHHAQPTYDEKNGAQRLIGTVQDITVLKQAREKQKTTVEILGLCNKAGSTRELMQSLMHYFQKITDCEAIGVRLRDGDDFPYYEQIGFVDNFLLFNNSLLDRDCTGDLVRDGGGKPVLGCLCGNVIRGLYDSTKPFFSARGSFWSSRFTKLLPDTTYVNRQAKTCNCCNESGYESVALIPVRFRGEVIGLFQFNDSQRGCFTIEKITQLESLIDEIAFPLAKLMGDEALQKSEISLLEAQKISSLGSYVYNLIDNRWTGTTVLSSMLGVDTHSDCSAAGWSELVNPFQQTDILIALKEAVEHNHPFDGEYRIVRKNDGVERWVHMLGNLEYDSTGTAIRMIGTLLDITARREAKNELRRYAHRLIEMEENLRKSLAAELHDEIGRDLTVIGINLSVINSSISDELLKSLSERIDDSSKLVKRISRTVRSIMNGLRPPVLDDFGLLAAIRWHSDLFSKRTGIAVFVQTEELFPRMNKNMETALFRISQEALMNTAKHAHTLNVTIRLWWDDGIFKFDIIDEGKGLNPVSLSPKKDGTGWGMKIMRERTEQFGGTFQVDSIPGKGTTISIKLPLEVM